MLASLKGDSEKLLTLEFTLNLKPLRPNVESFDDICDCFFFQKNTHGKSENEVETVIVTISPKYFVES